MPTREQHPDFSALIQSWTLAMRADLYSAKTILSYTTGLRTFAHWLRTEHPDVSPTDVTRTHMRAWIVHQVETTSSGTARSWFAGIRHFYRFLVAEEEMDVDPTEGIRTPAANQASTPTLSVEEIRDLLATCSGRGFTPRRDTAIIMCFLDGGLRLSEVASLDLDEADAAGQMLYITTGKGTNRSGPRRRAVPLGVRASRALDRYLRERARHPHAHLPQLWLGSQGRPTLGAGGVKRLVSRRAADAGITLHPHMFRHTWASAYRRNGGSEGDLMILGGWRNRQMLDRYGKADAEARAQEAARHLSFGDRI